MKNNAATRLAALALFFVNGFAGGTTWAATYNMTSTRPTCSSTWAISGTTYTCSATISRSSDDTYNLASGVVVNANITDSAMITINGPGTFNGNLTSTGGNGIAIQGGAVVNGNITGTGVSVVISGGSSVSGDISSSGSNGVSITDSTVLGGSISATNSTKVVIDNSTIGSAGNWVNISATNEIDIQNHSRVYGSVSTTVNSNNVKVDSTSSISGICYAGDYNSSQSGWQGGKCKGGTPPAGEPTAFNVFETGTTAGAVSGVIYTKTAGASFQLALVAILNNAQLSSFNGNVNVSLVANQTPGSNYGTNNCPTSSVTVRPATSMAIAGGRSNVNFAAVNEAYRDVRVLVQYPTSSPTVSVCSTDSFAIRPAKLSVMAQDADWTTAGTANTLNANASATAMPMHKAGRPFRLTVTAYNAVSPTAAVTVNYSAASLMLMPIAVVPVAVNTNNPGGLTAGVFDAGTFNGSNGVIVSTTASYGEAGIVSLQLTDQSFAQIDSGDGTSVGCTGWWICSPAISIGRFVPDHFSVSAAAACRASGKIAFTYSGQPFTTTVTAFSASGNVTQNYNTTAGFAKAVILSDVSTAIPDANGSWNATNGIAAAAFSAGVATVATPAFSLLPQPSSPTILQVRATDADGVSSSGYDDAAAAKPLIRFGRLRLFNAYGSVGAILSMPMQTQYWSANKVWVQNSDDSCTKITPASVRVVPVSPASSTPVTVGTASTMTFSGGSASLPLSPNSLVQTASADVAINLGASGSDQSCLASHGGAAGNLPWLRSLNGNCAATYDRDPSARATFGIYSAESKRIVHMRETFW